MDNIMLSNRFWSLRQPAWHGLGIVSQKPMTAVEAVKASKQDYEVVLRPVSVTGIGNVPNYRAIVRLPVEGDDQARLFSIVSDEYKVIQNLDIARLLDKELTKVWPVETVGSLGQGEVFFITLDAGSDQVAGEEIHKYFLAVDNKTGDKSFRLVFTPVRVVCQNTLVLGLRQATVTGLIEHRGNVMSNISLRVDALAQLRQADRETMKALDQMAKVKITDDQLHSIINAAYPEPPKPKNVQVVEDILRDTFFNNLQLDIYRGLSQKEMWEAAVERTYSLRSLASQLLDKFQDEYPLVAQTPWAAYNSVVECEDYRTGRGDEQDIAASALWGERAKAKVRAFRAAMTCITKTSYTEEA